jgi:hypothetical protein
MAGSVLTWALGRRSPARLLVLDSCALPGGALPRPDEHAPTDTVTATEIANATTARAARWVMTAVCPPGAAIGRLTVDGRLAWASGVDSPHR